VYDPIHTLQIPDGLETACDAVASFYLHDRAPASARLFDAPDASFFRVRQDMIEHLKQLAARDASAKRSLDMWLWGKARVTEVWTDRVLATLRQDLAEAFTSRGAWSLQILPSSFAGAGHHMAMGRSPNAVNWWLLDPASALYVFASAADLAGFTLTLLINSPEFNFSSRTVLLEITP
jgi:hypothetical protein